MTFLASACGLSFGVSAREGGSLTVSLYTPPHSKAGRAGRDLDLDSAGS